MMFISYMVTNDGQGSFWMGEMDLTCQPSECFWLVPGTESSDG